MSAIIPSDNEVADMATEIRTGLDRDIDAAYQYLAIARQNFSQKQIAECLGVDVRTVRRWETREIEPNPYQIGPALRQLILPFGAPSTDDKAFKFIDLFAGIGGIRAAFEGIGGQCVFTSEWDNYAQKTYAENFHDGHLIAGDITMVDACDVPDHDVLLAGFPCQPFSIAGVSKKNALGRAHGFHDETQGTLFFDVCRIIEAKQPRAFLLENVKNLMSHDKGRTFDVIRRALLDLGYHIHYRIIDGAHFTPQHRERIIIVGFREDVAFNFDAVPMPPKGSKVMRHVLHKTDGTEPRIEADGDKYFNHDLDCVPAKYTLTDKLWAYLQNYAAKHKAAGNGFGFGLVYPDSVSRTLSARYYKDGSEILVWQSKDRNPRRLTPRECARLMGFPDSYRIPVSDTKAYEQLSQAAVMPMIEAVAKLMAPHLINKEAAPTSLTEVPGIMATSKNWTKEQAKLAFHLYCQLPFGKLHKGNPEIIRLAQVIGRTPSAVAMKLVNFASLDPAITSTGRKGLDGASNLDREIWAEFHADWERLAVECEILRRSLDPEPVADEADELLVPEDFTGETRQIVTEQRIKQSFFRRAVLSSYGGRCCMSGVSEPRLLIASHIVPWSKDRQNRLNPSNGLCLSAIHDRAFDKGLITLSDDFKVIVSDELKRRDESFMKVVFLPLDGQVIALPERFMPNANFVAWHRTELFVDSRRK